jgi:hypothetical protein
VITSSVDVNVNTKSVKPNAPASGATVKLASTFVTVKVFGVVAET